MIVDLRTRDAFERAGWCFDLVANRWQREAAICSRVARALQTNDVMRQMEQVRAAIMYALARAAAGVET